jgi:23S rRNA pseudouridine1911/1915/1917 synthase
MSELCVDTGEYEEYRVTADADDDGRRLDAVIAARLPHISRSRAQALIDEGLVSVGANGALPRKSDKVRAGDVLQVTDPVRVPLRTEAEDIPLDIVYEDGALLVIDKPKGMVVHPAPGNETGTLVNALLFHAERSGEALPVIGGEVRPGIVHRIDKNTSGLLVVAKTDEAHRGLARQFAEHSAARVYTAIAAGGFKEDAGTVDASIGRDPKDRKRQAVAARGRRAVTHWRVVERLGRYTLLELRLETGRTHQIRVHLAHIGRPVLGDDLYGPARAAEANRRKGESQYLHAGMLGFTHPVSGEQMEFVSPLPTWFVEKLRELRGDV